MLKTEFNAFIPEPEKKPLSYVLFSPDEHTTRGRNHAFEGVSRLFAQRTSRPWVSVTPDELNRLYPGNENSTICRQKYLADREKPDVVFCSVNNWSSDLPDAFHVGNLFQYTDELKDYKKHLVCHHLTPEILQEGKKNFDEHYANIRKPLIAVLPLKNSDPEGFAAQLIKTVSLYPEATIFICGSWRTRPDEQAYLQTRLQKEIDARNMGDFVNIENFSMGKNEIGFNDYNPYIGLIAKADHVVLCGQSASIVSEVLFTGKTPLLKKYDPATSLSEEKLVYYFNGKNLENGFPTRNIEPISIISEVVDEIVNHFKSKGGYVPDLPNYKGLNVASRRAIT